MHNTTATLLLLLSALGVPAAAQQIEQEPLFSGRDAAWGGGFTAGTALLAPVDEPLARLLQQPSLQQNGALQHTAAVFRVLAHPGALIGITGAYAFGRVGGNEGVADVGLHAGAAFVTAEAATYLIKFLAGRARPYRRPDDPFDFGLFRGSDYDFQSFPSGHTAAAFAVASALTSEAGIRASDDQWWIGTLLYSAAALSGASRMYENQHWASDVLAAAAIGTFSGWKVTQYTHAHEGNELDGIFLGMTIRPGAGASIIALPRAWSPLAN
ncbi:MAG: phosphatase PAP2 family protein [Longimicrobiales bacterium]